MTWQISPFGNDQFFSSNGVLAVGYKLYTYLATTTTKEAVASDFAGSAFHTNPIVLNSIGLPPGAPIYIDITKSYKFVYATDTDTDPPSSPLYTADNITVKDLTNTLSEWVLGTTPTYISGTSFSLVGDQRTTYHVGRRVKCVAAGSTVYGVISASVFGAVTTITVLVDDGLTISASLNTVYYSFLSDAGSSWPAGFNTGLKTTLNASDARTNTVNTPLEINAQTTGTPNTNIGTGILLRAESGDEAPSDFGQLDFSASNITAGLEATYFRVWLRIAGAVLTECWRWAATGAFKGIFTHANTADRTYTLYNRDFQIGAADSYMGPSSTGSGSTAAHEGTVTIAGNQNLSGVHFYTDFTLNSGVTLTIPNDASYLCIVATGTITINGTIDGIGAGSAPGVAGAGAAGVGNNGFSQPGGAGGGNSTGSLAGGNGGPSVVHGVLNGVQAIGIVAAGPAGTQNAGSVLPIAHLHSIRGGASGGSSSNTAVGGRGGASIAFMAPTVVLANTAVLNTSGDPGGGGGVNLASGGGGGAGNVYVAARSYTDNGATFTLTGGAAGAGASGTAANGGAGATGVKQINLYA